MNRTARNAGGMLLLLFGLEFGAAGQIGPYPGGGYPPGRYPGGGYPTPGVGLPRVGGKRKQTSKDKQEPEQFLNVTGMLRSLEDKQIIIEAQDTRVLNLKRSDKTKFYKDGNEIKSAELRPGDHLMIEATQDQEGYLYAANVMLQKAGTPEERTAAARPTHVSTQASQGNGDDDERPVLRRADSRKPEEPEKKEEKEEPQAESRQPVAQAASDASPTEPATTTRPESGPDDPDYNNRPVLRRGMPPRQKRADSGTRGDTQEVAKVIAPPPLDAPVTRPVHEPEPEQAPQARKPDAMIEKARDAAVNFTETLPNYVCQQVTTRYINQSHVTSWQPLDIITAAVVYEDGRESYRDLAVNGKPTKKKMEELGGAWSKGEFGTVLRDLFSPSTAADFRLRKETTIAGVAATVYNFEVDREGSHWQVMVASQSVMPAYKGSVWLDKRSGRVLRIEMQARHIPGEFPLDTVESAVDYEYIRIGSSQQFLLPVHAETLSCQRGTNVCARNTMDFRNYHKYSGEAVITF